MSYRKPVNKNKAFTVLELLVVFSIIALLVSIGAVTYGSVKRNAADVATKETLRQVTLTMVISGEQEDGTFGDTFPEGVSVPSGIGLALTEVEDPETFCINATHSRYDDISYYSRLNEPIAEGLCSGDVIEGSIIGDYNDGAEGEGGGEEDTSASGAVGSGGGFALQTDAAWSQMTLSWTPVPGAQRYQIQTRNGPSGTWYYRLTSNGSSASAGESYNYSSHISNAVSSLVWTDSASIPRIVGQTFEYRYRYIDSVGTPSEWYTATLSALSESELPTLSGFTVVPNADWSNVTLSWNPISESSAPSPGYQIQTKSGAGGTWYYRLTTDGSSASAGESYNFSSHLPFGTDSYSWTSSNVVPRTTGQVYYYRARVKSTAVSGLYGPWSNEVLLSAPSTSDLIIPTNLTVTPNASWSNITLSWDPVSQSGIPQRYQIQTRNGPSGTWYYRLTTDGSSGSTGEISSYSSNVSSETNSIVWTSSVSVPRTAGQTFGYRIRTQASNMTGVYSPWSSEITLAAPVESNLSTVSGFSVTPAGDWSSVNLLWTPVSQSGIPQRYQIQTRSSSSGTWYYRLATDGSSGSTSEFSTFSSNISSGTSSLSWTSATSMPGVGQTHYYRIRTQAENMTGVYGPWTEFSLTR